MAANGFCHSYRWMGFLFVNELIGCKRTVTKTRFFWTSVKLARIKGFRQYSCIYLLISNQTWTLSNQSFPYVSLEKRWRYSTVSHHKCITTRCRCAFGIANYYQVLRDYYTTSRIGDDSVSNIMPTPNSYLQIKHIVRSSNVCWQQNNAENFCIYKNIDFQQNCTYRNVE